MNKTICNQCRALKKTACDFEAVFNSTEDNKAILENTMVEMSINTPPSARNCVQKGSDGINKNPGKKAIKNIPTFGFNTLITKPCWYKSIGFLYTT